MMQDHVDAINEIINRWRTVECKSCGQVIKECDQHEELCPDCSMGVEA